MRKAAALHCLDKGMIITPGNGGSNSNSFFQSWLLSGCESKFPNSEGNMARAAVRQRGT